MSKVVLTREGLKNLEEELANLKAVKRPEIAEKIKEARDFGDLSENSEYEAALNAQAIMEARISYIEEQLKDVSIMEDSDIQHDVVSVGSRVTVYDAEMEEASVYDIVGKTESAPDQNKISDQSPFGRALIGKKLGSTVTVCAPAGDFEIEIRKIERF